MTLMERRLAWQELAKSGRSAQLTLSLLSSFTINPIVPYLGLALEELGMPVEIGVGPYGQVVQECLDPASATAKATPDILVVWVRLEDLWAGKPLPLDDPTAGYVEDLLEVVDAALTMTDRGATLVFVLPAVPELRPLGVGDAGNPRGVFAAAAAAREAARQRLAAAPGVLIA